MDSTNQKLPPDNYTPDGKTGQCIHRDVSKGYGEVPAECRHCVHRPVYTVECDIEKCLDAPEDVCTVPSLNDYRKWRELGEDLAGDFDLKTARKCFVHEYVSRRASEARESFYLLLLRTLDGRIAANIRRLMRFARWYCQGGSRK